MIAGQTYPVSLTFRNDGNTVWSTANGYKLGPADDNGQTWNVFRTALPNSVAPGQTVTFNLTVTAPSTLGTQDFSRQVLEEGVKRFPVITHSSVSVRNADDAAFVSQSVPSTLTVGQTATVTVTMQNTGGNSWTSGGANPYGLGSENTQDNTTWGLYRVPLPTSPVVPDGQAAFTFTITAPTTSGTYDFQWQMLKEGLTHFGAFSPDVIVTVVPPPPPPNPPSGLSAASVSDTEIDLAWSDNSANETGFLVERSADGSTAWKQVASLPANTTSYPNTGLTAFTIYYYRVRAALTGSANSSPSNVANATTRLPAPTGLTATPGNAQVSLTWNVVTGAAKYTVKRGDNANGPFNSLPTQPTTNSYADTGLTNNTAYFYKVSAQPASGAGSSNSNLASATPQAPPAAPTNLNATTDPTNGVSQINVTWSASSGAMYYTLQRSLDGSTGWTDIVTQAGTSYSDTGLSARTTYYYRVRATAVGDSGYSNTDHATTTPTAPTGLTATAGNNQVVLTWTKSPGAAGYNVYRSTQASQIDSVPVLNSTPLPSTQATYTDNTAVNGTPYYYVVRAINSGGESPDSNVAYAKPDAPHIANLTLSGPAVTGGNTVTGTLTLSGPAPTGGSVVNLTSSDASVTVPASVTLAAGATSKNFTITTASISIVTQVTVAGTLNKWMQASILTVTPANQSYSIQNLGVVPGNTSCLVFWKDVLPEGAVQGYNVYRQSAGVSRTKLNAIPQVAPYYADTGLSNGTTYQYQVAVVDAGGQEKTVSSYVSALPAASIPTLLWMGSPTSDVSGTINLYTQLSTGSNTANLTLLVDGKLAGGGGISANISDTADQTSMARADLDTAVLSNGSHVVQAFGPITGDTVGVTPPITINVSNVFSSFLVDDIAQSNLGEVCQIDTLVPADTSSWNVQIIHDDDATQVRSWSGAGNVIHLAWDGKDTSGTDVAEDNYRSKSRHNKVHPLPKMG